MSHLAKPLSAKVRSGTYLTSRAANVGYKCFAMWRPADVSAVTLVPW